LKLALAGDTMLGRKVAEAIAANGPESLVADELVEVAQEADLFVLNLECCISERGEPWPDPVKPFFFRAPPAATELLRRLGVDCVTLANNHALDFGTEALLDTFEHLQAAEIAWSGANPDREAARAAALLEAGGLRLAVLACSDHPADYAATECAPGIAYGLDWVPAAVAQAHADADAVLVSPHWGPNMSAGPVPYVLRAAAALVEAGATLVAGHSAHVFHGVAGPILYDLGDFLDDYAVDPVLRNDLGLLFLVDIDGGRPAGLEAVPLKLDYCHTRLADGEETAWIARRFRSACAALGIPVSEERGRLIVDLRT
jgi:poly-gamma-glutamate capsule biosynthesis protein CapA/YwtB (metallophosphatase superfamily)